MALFADILTMKEALEFDRHINSREDFQLTSCCCPVWIAMIRRVYRELIPHVPGAVSPMIAAGRVVKRLHPDAVTVFVGPCMAKKSEARETDIADAVDYVLTFEEMADIFAAADIRPQELPEKKKEHASRAGTDLRSHRRSQRGGGRDRPSAAHGGQRAGKGGTGDEWAGKGPAGNEPAGGWRACLAVSCWREFKEAGWRPIFSRVWAALAAV